MDSCCGYALRGGEGRRKVETTTRAAASRAGIPGHECYGVGWGARRPPTPRRYTFQQITMGQVGTLPFVLVSS